MTTVKVKNEKVELLKVNMIERSNVLKGTEYVCFGGIHFGRVAVHDGLYLVWKDNSEFVSDGSIEGNHAPFVMKR